LSREHSASHPDHRAKHGNGVAQVDGVLFGLLCGKIAPCYLKADKRLEAGDHVEKFLVDATLTQTVKCAVEILQQFVDVPIGAFHRRQAARVLAREGFGTRSEERDEKVFADECP